MNNYQSWARGQEPINNWVTKLKCSVKPQMSTMPTSIQAIHNRPESWKNLMGLWILPSMKNWKSFLISSLNNYKRKTNNSQGRVNSWQARASISSTKTYYLNRRTINSQQWILNWMRKSCRWVTSMHSWLINQRKLLSSEPYSTKYWVYHKHQTRARNPDFIRGQINLKISLPSHKLELFLRVNYSEICCLY